MTITTKEGFKTTIGLDGERTLLFDSSRSTECCDFAIKENIKRVSLNEYQGYSALDLNPILPIKDFIEGLILNEKLNYGQLYLFTKVKFLGALDNQRDDINLENFPFLQTLACNISKRLKGLESCKNLSDLTINKYKSITKNLELLPKIETLRRLSLFQPNIVTLKGIEKFAINRLSIYKASNLDSISSLSSLSNVLSDLEIEKCKKVQDYEVLGDIQSLEKIIITESGNIKSLSFIQKLPKLKFISFWGTNVIDGDLSYCKGIKYVGFDDKKHYSDKSAQFKQNDDISI